MTLQTTPMTDDDRFAQASAWHFRLQAEDASAEDRAAFAAWLAANAANAQAWDEAQALLSALQAPARAVRMERVPCRRALPWAAAALLVLALGLAWQSPWPDRLRADHYTAVGETRSVELADGSRIELDTDAALSVELAPHERRVRLLRGEAWFEVAHDPARPFVVDGGEARVRVLGTQFGVARRDGHTRVRLAQGRIRAGTGSDESVVLLPGQEIDAESGHLSAARAFDPKVAFAWRQRQLVFQQRPLGEVVAELDRYWPGRLLLSDAALERKVVSGVFDIDKPEAVLRALQLTFGLRVERYTPYLTLLRPAESAGL
ncbi:Protein FecR [compost metagenome]